MIAKFIVCALSLVMASDLNMYDTELVAKASNSTLDLNKLEVDTKANITANLTALDSEITIAKSTHDADVLANRAQK
jgi:hypothetical protein